MISQRDCVCQKYTIVFAKVRCAIKSEVVQENRTSILERPGVNKSARLVMSGKQFICSFIKLFNPASSERGKPRVCQGYTLGYVRGICRGMSGVYEPGLWGIKGYKRVYIRDS
jgi:hypothetical protein